MTRVLCGIMSVGRRSGLFFGIFSVDLSSNPCTAAVVAKMLLYLFWSLVAAASVTNAAAPFFGLVLHACRVMYGMPSGEEAG